MKKLLFGIIAALMCFGCGQSYEETKQKTRAQQRRLAREDSAALKIAVMPTLDCLPLFVAEDHQLFDTIVDIRLKTFTAQMDCDSRDCPYVMWLLRMPIGCSLPISTSVSRS